MADSPTTRYSLRIAAGPDAPASARLFVAATLRVLDMDEEVIDDARLAVSELVTASVTQSAGAIVEILLDASTMEVAVSPLDSGDLEPDAALVVAGLFDLTAGDKGMVGFAVRPSMNT